MKVTLIFDIGKTNKKCFLFDKNYQVVYQEYIHIQEIEDEDGYPCDDLKAIQKWIKQTLKNILKKDKWTIQAINFSTYGASLVHLDKHGQPLTPLYNYLKPLPKKILQSFYKKYGKPLEIASETASPASGMLNAGFQLFWLKYTQPTLFKKIKWSMHLPQYLSGLLTDKRVSDFTSIGCHTSLWNYKKEAYHDWVYAGGFDKILPSIVDTSTTYSKIIRQKPIKVGIGIHDSSAALLPYLKALKKPFALISTGTWSISLNPFNKTILTAEDLKNNCLNYMQINGKPVKASRLFLGKEYQLQVEQLAELFKVKNSAHKKVKFNESVYKKLTKNYQRYFKLIAITTKHKRPITASFKNMASFEEGYHQLMLELVELQVAMTKQAIGVTKIKHIYIDGGFVDNEIFIQLLARAFRGIKVKTTQSPIGSALGAAMVMTDKKVKPNFLKKHFKMLEHPVVLI